MKKKALESYIKEVDEAHGIFHEQTGTCVTELYLITKQLLERIEKLEQLLRQFPVQAEPVKPMITQMQGSPICPKCKSPQTASIMNDEYSCFFCGNKFIVPHFGAAAAQQPHEFAPVHPKFRPLAQLIKEENERINKWANCGTAPPAGQK